MKFLSILLPFLAIGITAVTAADSTTVSLGLLLATNVFFLYNTKLSILNLD